MCACLCEWGMVGGYHFYGVCVCVCVFPYKHAIVCFCTYIILYPDIILMTYIVTLNQIVTRYHFAFSLLIALRCLLLKMVQIPHCKPVCL